MKRAYKVCRGILAGSALTVLALFGFWHLIVWKIQCQYRIQNEAARTKGNP